MNTEPREQLTDLDEYQAIVLEARKEVGRIVAAGGMATKTKVENYLMPKYNLTRYAAHEIMNYIEYHNLRWIVPEQ